MTDESLRLCCKCQADDQRYYSLQAKDREDVKKNNWNFHTMNCSHLFLLFEMKILQKLFFDDFCVRFFLWASSLSSEPVGAPHCTFSQGRLQEK